MCSAPLRDIKTERTLVTLSSSLEKKGMARTADAKTPFTAAILQRMGRCTVGSGASLQHIATGARDVVVRSVQDERWAREVPAVKLSEVDEMLFLSGESEPAGGGGLEDSHPFEKFVGGFEADSGSAENFPGGLVSLVGEPRQDVEAAIEDEHCAVPDFDSAGRLRFGASDYPLVAAHYNVRRCLSPPFHCLAPAFFLSAVDKPSTVVSPPSLEVPLPFRRLHHQVRFTPRVEYQFVTDPKFSEKMDAGVESETNEALGSRTKVQKRSYRNAHQPFPCCAAACLKWARVVARSRCCSRSSSRMR